MSIYLVPFEEKELVWTKWTAKIKADSREEALEIMEKICKEGDPHNVQNEFGYDYGTTLNCQFVDISEHIESDKEFNVLDYKTDDVKEVDERIRCELELTAFDIARYGKDELYAMAEEKFTKVGLILDITEMELIPIKIDEDFVTYDAIPIDYTRTWSNGDESVYKNNEMITPLHESLLLFNENIMSTSCDYNRSTAIKLPVSFDIQRIDKRMKELKTDVVTFKENTYIVDIFDSGYALWECEV
jgi:hypothetical protein